MMPPARKEALSGPISSVFLEAWEVFLWVVLLALSIFLLNRFGDPFLSHNVTEMFSVIIACGIFMLTWNARRVIDNQYFVFLGIGFLFFGAVDFLHTIAFRGSPTQDDIEIHTRLWFTARILYCSAFLGAPFFVGRKVRPALVFGGFSAATAALILLSFAMEVPAFADAGSGLPIFRKFGSRAVFGLLILAVAMHWRVRGHFDRKVFIYLVLSVTLFMGSDFAAGLSPEATVDSGLAGYYLKTLSFYLAYKSVVETGLRRPYDLLFRNLKRSEAEVRSSRDDLEVRVAERTAEIRGINERLSRELDARNAVERERETTIDLLRLLLESKDHRKLVSAIAAMLSERLGCRWVGIRYGSGGDYPHIATHGLSEGKGAEAVFCTAGAGNRARRSSTYLDCFCGTVLTGRQDTSLPCFTAGGSFWTNDVRRLLEERPEIRLLVRRGGCPRTGVESLALIPLRVGGETIGLLQFCDPRKDRFTPESILQRERIAGYIAVGLARLLSKEELRESEGRFRALVEDAPVGILIVQDGAVVFRNPVLERLFGEIPDRVRFEEIGRIHPEDRGKFQQLCAAVESGIPSRRNLDLRFLPSDGADAPLAGCWVYCQAVPVEYGGKNASLVVFDDMTRLKDLEQIVSTREKLSVIGQMAAGIAHEVRNPLSGININLSTLAHLVRSMEGVSPEEAKKLSEIVSQAKAASDKIAAVVRRVMDFAKQAPPKLDRTDVNQVIRDALAFFSVSLRKSGVAVELSLSPELPGCKADPHLLEQVLLNLITNAVQAMESSEGPKQLGLATGLEGGSVVIRVSDNGPGIPVHLRNKVFDPFYTTRRTGHGIGLSFSYRVIESHGGMLTAGQSEWGGAEFRISLPLGSERSPA